jgi:hypothetical protein
MELETPRHVDDLVVVANTRHGPRAHANAEGDMGETHDHLTRAVEAREFLATRIAVPDGMPGRGDLANLRTLRRAVEDLEEHGTSFPQPGVGRLLLSTSFRLDDRGALVPAKAGWPGFTAALLLALRELSATDLPLKRCRNTGCRWLFIDRSRNHARQWCEMAMCGNRAKVARFRHRRQPTAAA